MKHSRHSVYFVRFFCNKCRCSITFAHSVYKSLHSPMQQVFHHLPVVGQEFAGSMDHSSFTFICPCLSSRRGDLERSCLVLITRFVLVYVLYNCQASATQNKNVFHCDSILSLLPNRSVYARNLYAT